MKKILTLLLTTLLLCTLFAGCKKEQPAPNGDPTTDAPQSEGTGSMPANIRVWTLNGTTGFGMAPLIESAKEGKAAQNYTFTVETNAANVRDAIINGNADIAAVPTNVAAMLYNATNGGVKVLALNTGGVLYLLANTSKVAAVSSLAELSGKTVYCPAQNPAFIAKALIQKSAVDGITLDTTTYADPTDLRTAVASGLVDYAILPEPMVTIAITAAAKNNVTVTAALDLTAEWNKYLPQGSLVQGCVVVRADFLTAYPAAVTNFLQEYKASIEAVVADPAAASAKIVSAGIFAQAPVAQSAIPKCNLCFVTGSEMKAALAAFLAQMPLPSIGGALPQDDFYFGA